MARSKTRANRSGGGRGSGNGAAPSDLLHEAGAEWRLAFRYAGAAAKPALGRGVERVKERSAAALANRASLKDHLNPAQTTKGGRVGDAADALLAKLGTPGKLAAKASLGSRAMDRVIPDALLEAPDEPTAEDGPSEEGGPSEEDGPSEEGGPSEEDGPSAEGGPSEEDGPSAEDEPTAETTHAPESEDAQGDDASDAIEEDETSGDDAESDPVIPPGEVEHKEIPSEYEHAYTEELENYEHREAYATTGS